MRMPNKEVVRHRFEAPSGTREPQASLAPDGQDKDIYVRLGGTRSVLERSDTAEGRRGGETVEDNITLPPPCQLKVYRYREGITDAEIKGNQALT